MENNGLQDYLPLLVLTGAAFLAKTGLISGRVLLLKKLRDLLRGRRR